MPAAPSNSPQQQVIRALTEAQQRVLEAKKLMLAVHPIAADTPLVKGMEKVNRELVELSMLAMKMRI